MGRLDISTLARPGVCRGAGGAKAHFCVTPWARWPRRKKIWPEPERCVCLGGKSWQEIERQQWKKNREWRTGERLVLQLGIIIHHSIWSWHATGGEPRACKRLGRSLSLLLGATVATGPHWQLGRPFGGSLQVGSPSVCLWARNSRSRLVGGALVSLGGRRSSRSSIRLVVVVVVVVWRRFANEQ